MQTGNKLNFFSEILNFGKLRRKISGRQAVYLRVKYGLLNVKRYCNSFLKALIR
jgi:hypothetical protein